MGQKVLGTGKLLPDLWQKGGAIMAQPQNDPVDTRAQPGDKIGAISIGKGLRLAEYGNFDMNTRKLLYGKFREAIIMEGGIDGIAPNTFIDGVNRLKISDTSTQLSAYLQGNKGSTSSIQGLIPLVPIHPLFAVSCSRQFLGNGLPGQSQQEPALLFGYKLFHVSLFPHPERFLKITP
jgi:hypothetical protein